MQILKNRNNLPFKFFGMYKGPLSVSSELYQVYDRAYNRVEGVSGSGGVVLRRVLLVVAYTAVHRYPFK